MLFMASSYCSLFDWVKKTVSNYIHTILVVHFRMFKNCRYYNENNLLFLNQHTNFVNTDVIINLTSQVTNSVRHPSEYIQH